MCLPIKKMPSHQNGRRSQQDTQHLTGSSKAGTDSEENNMKYGKYEFDDIQGGISQFQDLLESMCVAKKMSKYICLQFEEILLEYSGRDPEGQLHYTLNYKDRLFAESTIELHLPGEKWDPLSLDDLVIVNLLKIMPDVLKYRYINKENIVIFRPPTYNSIGSNFRNIWRYLGAYRKKLILCVIIQVISLLLQIGMPLVSAWLITSLTNSAFVQVVYVSLIYFVMEFLYNKGFFYYMLQFEKLYKDMLAGIEVELANNLMKTKLAVFDELGTGVFIQRMTTDIQQMTQSFMDTIDHFGDVITKLGKLVSILFIFPPAFFFILLETILQAWLELKKVRLVNEKDNVFRSQSEEFSSVVGELIHGARDIRLLRSEDAFVSHVKDLYDQSNESSFIMKSAVRKYRRLRRNCDSLTKAIFTVLVAYAAYRGDLSAAMAVVIYNFRTDLSNIPFYVGEALTAFKKYNLTTGRIFSLCDEIEFPREHFGERVLEHCRGKMEFKNVNFAYGSTRVLKGLNLTINPGETVAIVGQSGCGKSTVLNLIVKLIEPQSGQILFDDMDINELDVDSVRSNITMVSQTPYLFNMSIRDNLLLVKKDADDGLLEQACRDSDIHDEICKMHDGYDTILGEGGITISGGQRQRIAIARMILRDTPVVLLDEATSALDNISQNQIIKTLKNLRGDHTIVIVAHRLSTIVNCDRILFMEEGSIAAQGTHKELLESCPQYRKLYMGEMAG